MNKKGSISLAGRRIVWRPEERDTGLRSECVEEDIDFIQPPNYITPRAYIRRTHSEVQVSVLVDDGPFYTFKKVLDMPADTPLGDAIEATLNLLRLRMDTAGTGKGA